MNDAFWRRFLVPGALWLAFFFAVPFGIGMGLTLARRLIELHGGSLDARSQGIGHGS